MYIANHLDKEGDDFEELGRIEKQVMIRVISESATFGIG